MTRADWILLAVVAVLLPGLYAALWQGTGVADSISVRSADGEPVSASLARDQDITIQGRLGASTIEIRNGRARFRDSPCTAKVCINTGWLQHSGEVAACLPNGVSVQLTGGVRRFDAINF
ncbi:MAG: NusG domain II-containing protein [Gammaproteobacteria bacterium]|nr:NusG domain II-containing protein [Gammaproteobacteria bacterium]NIR28330.1 NusG domain II-containing protein [Gammaproteobacteria bacterium]NIR96744.1 NusG domain II-containing protein [Gammaproteobacteria bacterium]NIT62446.1 NusG domain II-containing protein [Gammaproteobacteria bacterium]NIV19379.1 hypothetical protein [Gammaproteobacteria bacterium]